MSTARFQPPKAGERMGVALAPSRSRVFSIEVPAALISAVDETVKRFVHTRRQAPISRNEFIRLAIAEKLDHLRRSRDVAAGATRGALGGPVIPLGRERAFPLAAIAINLAD